MATKTAKTTQPKDSSGNAITFSRGAMASREGIANAARNQIVNNVQTAGGKAVKGSTLRGRDVSGMSAGRLADPNEEANVLAEAASFAETPNPFAGAAPKVDTTQPPPGAVSATPYTSKEFIQTDPNDPTLRNDRGEKVDYSTYLAQGGNADFSNVRKAFQEAVASGAPAPQEGGAARTQMGAMAGAPAPDFAKVDAVMSEDQGLNELLETRKELLAAESQRTSLTEEYSKLSKKLGINELNTELMDMKRVIEGTEDDIRNEVTKAGGFATESQVMAMSYARNKVLVKNYNTLLETKQAAQEQLNTMMSLAVQDRQAAQQSLQTRLQLDAQISEYKYRMQQNAVQAYERVASRMGYDGLQQMAGNDPYYTSLIEKTMGLGQGGLAKLAQADAAKKAQIQAQQDFENRMQERQLAISAGNLAVSRRNADLAELRLNYELNKDMEADAEERQAKADLAAETMNKMNLKVQDIDTLLSHSGLNSAVGPTGFTRMGLLDKLTGKRADFIGKVQKLTSQETLDNIIRLKQSAGGVGTLSDQDIRILREASTSINNWAQFDEKGNVTGYAIDQGSFRRELEDLKAATARLMAGAAGLTGDDISKMDNALK